MPRRRVNSKAICFSKRETWSTCLSTYLLYDKATHGMGHKDDGLLWPLSVSTSSDKYLVMKQKTNPSDFVIFTTKSRHFMEEIFREIQNPQVCLCALEVGVISKGENAHPCETVFRGQPRRPEDFRIVLPRPSLQPRAPKAMNKNQVGGRLGDIVNQMEA